MATIIFDLDDTLYNTQKYKDDIHDVLSSHQITHDDILNSYKTAREGAGYTFDRHLEVLSATYAHIEAEREIILSKLKTLLDNVYVFPKIADFLKELRQQSHTLILLTTGKETAQLAKIERAGIKDFFDKICITQEAKHEFLKNLELEGNIYIVNDKADENSLIKEALPHVTIIEMKNGEPILFDSPVSDS